MTNFLQSRKLVWTFVVVAVLVIGLGVVAALLKRQNNTDRVVTMHINKYEVPLGQLPDKFPTNLPAEAGAKVTQNYTSTTPDGRFQATRTYETAKTLDENYSLYQDYFQKNGWQLQTGEDGKDIKLVSASKDGLKALVTITANQSTKVRVVDVTFTQTLE